MRLRKFFTPAALAGFTLLVGTVSAPTLAQVYQQGQSSQVTSNTATKPNLYNLKGGQIQITYSTSGIDGKPHFNYQDAQQTLSFVGGEIRTTPSELGTLVSVSIRRTVDTGSTSFTLLVPNVNLNQGKTAQVTTEGITTVHRFSVIPKFNQGQTESYAVTPLTGTARSVAF